MTLAQILLLMDVIISLGGKWGDIMKIINKGTSSSSEEILGYIEIWNLKTKDNDAFQIEPDPE